jgi:hypothetical protein
MTGNVPYDGQSELAVCGEVLAKQARPSRPLDGFFSRYPLGDRIWHQLHCSWYNEPSYRPTAHSIYARVRGASALRYC